MNFKNYFKDKKVTIMGLGLLGRGLGDTKFLAEQGAEIIVTDLKKEADLKTSLQKLKNFKNIKYVLGEHRLEDFRNRDFILKAAGVPLDSPFVDEARKNNILIEMSSSLFVKLSGIKTIGITGTRGKSTVTHLLYEIIKNHLKKTKSKVFLGGNVKGVSTLEYLNKVKKDDVVVLELDSWQLQGFGESRISPNISVFTNIMVDHMNYYKNDMDKYLDDKANIFKYQKKGDSLIVGEEVFQTIKEKYGKQIKSKIIVAKVKNLPKDLKIELKGNHNLQNISLAVEAARALEIGDEIIFKTVADFQGVPGRLEFLREYKGVKIYNDTTATTPDATLAGLKALSVNKNVVLIMGGADKKLDMSNLVKQLPKYCKKVVLLPGTGTDKLNISGNFFEKSTNLDEAVKMALKNIRKGDIVLLSPAFASFGLFKNEFDRGDQFIKIVKKLK
ncbi:UDP-N-acetylmuramoyl-L-alanine--D-glutamate ligase [Candidatus Nomurabacteria bacterium]|nr:UDP-N-acetylmuramoyl-L-alanine--D-glutamate ligase [Candidatus Nomurabacteria bacterium]